MRNNGDEGMRFILFSCELSLSVTQRTLGGKTLIFFFSEDLCTRWNRLFILLSLHNVYHVLRAVYEDSLINASSETCPSIS